MKDQLSTDCPARQMARQFIANFNRHAGVENSEEKEQMAKDIVKPSRRAARARVDSFLATPPPYEPPHPSIRGLRYVRERVEDCEIGEAVTSCVFGCVPFDIQIIKVLKNPNIRMDLTNYDPQFMDVDIMTFEKFYVRTVHGHCELWRRTA